MRRLVLFGRVGFGKLFKNNNSRNVDKREKKYSEEEILLDSGRVEINSNLHTDAQYRNNKRKDSEEIKKRDVFKMDNINKQEPIVAKQKEKIVHVDYKLTEINNHSNSSNKLHLLLQQRNQMLQSAQLLPAYCDSISSLLNKQSFHVNQQALSQINRKLNDLSFDLTSSPQQYLSILNYRYRCRLFQSKFSEVDNYKFIQKATVICQMLIHKKQLELNQVIFVMEALLRMGSLTVVLLMNFTKYVKNQLQDEKTKERIGLEHVLTILNMGVIKRNEITLENILYDQVLNFMLKHMDSLIRDKPIWMKVETLNLLLVIDTKRFYKIDRKSKEIWTKKLFRDVIAQIDHNWMGQMVQNTASNRSQENGKCNWKSVLAITEAIDFAHQNRLQELIYEQQCDQFINRVIQTIYQFNNNQQGSIAELSEDKKQALLRIIFSSRSMSVWSTNSKTCQKLTQLTLSLKLNQQHSFLPIVDLLYYSKSHHNTEQHAQLITIAHQIHMQYSKTMNLYALLFALKQNGVNNITIQGQNRHQTNRLIDRLTDYFISQQYNKQKSIEQNKLQLQKLLQKHSQHQKANALIVTCHQIAINLRNYKIVLNAFQSIWNIINTNNIFWQKMKQSNLLKQQNRLLLQLLVNTIISGQQLPPQLNELTHYLIKQNNLKNTYLNRCYPPTYSFAYDRNNQYNIFSDCQNFTHKFQRLEELYREEKYSFYCWDLLIKQLPRLPVAGRRQAFPLVQRVFLNAFDKDNLRKVVLLTVLTNHICANTIIAQQQKLKDLIKRCIGDLIKAQEIIEYHYQCYVQIVINALSCDLLEMDTFNTIMKHTYQKSPQIKQTTTLLLLYGSTIYRQSGMVKEKERAKVESQKEYLKMLINKNYLVQQTYQAEAEMQRRDSSIKARFSIYISGRLIAIYLRFGIKQLAKLERLVLKYVKQCVDFTEWQLIARSYNSHCFHSPTEKQQSFLRNLSSHMHQKLPLFQHNQFLSPNQTKQLTTKLT